MKIHKQAPETPRPSRFDPNNTLPNKVELFTATPADDAALFLRTGNCTVGCGACCEAVMIPVKDLDRIRYTPDENTLSVPYLQTLNGSAFEDFEHWLELHDIFLVARDGDLMVELPTDKLRRNPGRIGNPSGTAEEILSAFDVRLVDRMGVLHLYVPLACGELQEDGRCGVYGQPSRPAMCNSYPQHPSDIEGLPFCTYRFTPITTDELREAYRAAQRPKPRQKKRRRRK